MNWTKEDIELVKKIIEIKNKGFYCDGKQLTEVYNRVLNKNVAVTNCGSCLRQRVLELETALNHFEAISKASESVSDDKPTVIKEEENKAVKKENKKVKK